MFLQANIQNVLGKPKHQVLSEKQTVNDEKSVILKRFYEKEGFYNNLETTQIISLIYSDYKQDIENILSLRLVSDCQFVSTVKMIMSMAIFYILFMVVPFLIQLRTNDNQTVFICLSLMLLVQLFLFGVELL